MLYGGNYGRDTYGGFLPFSYILVVSTTDSVTVSEDLKLEKLSFLAINDTLNLTDVISLGTIFGNFFVSVNDTLSVSELVTFSTGISTISVNDVININENTNVERVSGISVSDAISLTETISLESFRFSAGLIPRGSNRVFSPVGEIGRGF